MLVLGDEASGGPLFYRPVDVDIDPDGNIYVLDTGDARVSVFSPDGDPLGSFGRQGQGPGEFSFSEQDSQSSVSVNNDVILVADAAARSLLLFDHDYQLIDSVQLAATPGSVSLVDDTIHMVTYGMGRTVTLGQYSLRGDLLARTPSTIRDRWPRQSVRTYVAGRGGSYIEAYVYWPVVRLYEREALREEVWLDFSWAAEEWIRSYLHRSRETAESFTEDMLESNPILGALLFMDLDAAPAARKWMALFGGDLVHEFSDVHVARLELAFSTGRGAGIMFDMERVVVLSVDEEVLMVYGDAVPEVWWYGGLAATESQLFGR